MHFKKPLIQVIPPFIAVFVFSVLLFFFFFQLKQDAALAYQMTGIAIMLCGALIGAAHHFQENNPAGGIELSFYQQAGLTAFVALAYGFALQLLGLVLA